MSLDEVMHTFIAEARGLLHDMEESLLRLEAEPGDADALNAVFRAAHTIKGSAGVFGLQAIVGFTHTAESVLDLAREGRVEIDGDFVSAFLACRDHIAHLLECIIRGVPASVDLLAQGETLAQTLAALAPALLVPPPAGKAAEALRLPVANTEEGAWHISLRFGRDAFRQGMDPASFIRYLGSVGDIVHLVTLADALPPPGMMEPECCYLGFEVRVAASDEKGGLDRTRIEEVFEFVRDDCRLRILPPGSVVADYLELIDAVPETADRLGEILVACGALTEHELAGALGRQDAAGLHAVLGEVPVAERTVAPQVVEAALVRQQENRQHRPLEMSFIRVQADKLDHLINLVGELVIASAGVGMLAQRKRDGDMLEAVSAVSRLVEDIRDGAMRLRMVEIGDTFNRFRRVVRDVSREIGKDIDLVIDGGDTELDKSVVERIGDPLTHLVRNAMDHGIEPAERRLAAGKPAAGRVSLNAFHESGNIVIEVADDGGGLDRGRILAKAQERGLVDVGAVLADEDVWQLIFEPGFSTAAQVSNLSGRGVGMDVVKRAIEALRGTIEIDSRPGAGTTFRIRLPLTLAIIDGFLLAVGGGHYVVPLDMVLECVELDDPALHRRQGCLNLRGEVLPLLDLAQHFGLPQVEGRRRNVVVVQWAGHKAGLVVDALEGELQAVMKPLGRLFVRLRGIAGSTILGSGEVALMLDLQALIEDASCAPSASSKPSAA